MRKSDFCENKGSNWKFQDSSLFSETVQAGLCQTWSETAKTGFLAPRISCKQFNNTHNSVKWQQLKPLNHVGKSDFRSNERRYATKGTNNKRGKEEMPKFRLLV